MQTNNRFDFNDIFEDEKPVVVSEEVKKQLASIAENAKACLNTAVFDKYKQNYQAMLPKMMDVMVQYTNEFRRAEISLEQYAVNMACYVTKVQDLRALLLTVEIESKKSEIVVPDSEEV